MMRHITVQKALTNLPSTDRDAVFTTMMDVVRANPGHAQAWLYLGLCSDTLAQRRDCLERALRLDPLDPSIHAAMHEVQEQEAAAMRTLLSGCRPLAAPPPMHAPKHIGTYFQAYGVEDEYIQQALRIQRTAPLSGRRPLLGEILVAQGWISPERAAQLLIHQTQLRVEAGTFERPVMLGEFLVRKGYISIEQLHTAMLAQLRIIQAGSYCRLGEVLLNEHQITEAQLKQALHQQEEEYKTLLY
ncbi:hypothetical protein SE17_22115 [Kouleothrix aurantiaca]|jgi:hypothetical protein|uniref:Uncharacterized protein n=1 Tax=Kouleothrix aurantiaca TaxID=186479 RepID=A0A0P9CY37_9CHLR|nr:hypothetical protein SE17_22115 [Kouleothrix aurantiaca]